VEVPVAVGLPVATLLEEATWLDKPKTTFSTLSQAHAGTVGLPSWKLIKINFNPSLYSWSPG
jgi:hypothetical protein